MLHLVRRTGLVGVLVILLLGAATAAGSANSTTSRACGSFKVPMLRPRVRVRVVQGSVACSTARRVMRWTYTSYESSFVRHHDGWTTYGPQTCDAWATKDRLKITGRCGPA